MTETIWCVSELRKTRNSVPLNFGLIFSCGLQKRSLSKKQSRQLGTWHVPARCVYSLKEFTYLWHLHIYGILKCPDTCPKCGTGGMQGPFARKDVGTEHLHWHCDNRDCRARHNVLAFSGRFGVKWDRFNTLTPGKFYQLLLAYWGPRNGSTSSKIPKRNNSTSGTHRM